MSLFFNTLSRFVTAFLSRRKHLLISWMQSLSTEILENKRKKIKKIKIIKKIKSVTGFIFSPSICHAVMGSDVMILVF